ncbi:permease [Pedobacter ginsenosidimutans]|uniref:Probable membrane transporter protein n=1 Tax=Pedobacter ginsenosidimutans TaxID=687842 RepID=A0A0T5VVI5_9SPHI|nr:sulfite exporter TauE/SafE family protein [Pedobacter ginsenosidimutans]KRT17867.1 permease [Pedobacter ginsenosidimutans]
MISQAVAYMLAAVVGISLGLIGSGGSILMVPILVYILGIEPILATTYSLFIVGMTSLIGGISGIIQKSVIFPIVFIFGIPSIISVYLTRAFIIPVIPNILFSINGVDFTRDVSLMVIFSMVMILSSVSMIKKPKSLTTGEGKVDAKKNVILFLQGTSVGILAGLVGAGGGFLIIPALVLLGRIPMKKAIVTSLCIIALNSVIGFAGSLQSGISVDWKFLLSFTLCSVIGIFTGIYFSQKVQSAKLKIAFGWFVMFMGIYILFKELVP